MSESTACGQVTQGWKKFMRIKYSILRSVETLTPFFFLLQETDLASNSKNTLKETYADASGNML